MMSRLVLLAGRICAVLLLLAMLAPFLYAVWMSFAPGELLEPPTDRWSLRWYGAFFDSPKWTNALWTTAKVAVLSVIGSLLGGLGVAVAVTRYQFRCRTVLSALVMLPMFVPGVVLGMGLLPLVREIGLWGTVTSLAAAHSLISLPVVYLILQSALSGTNPDLELAARGLGAGPWTAFRRITLPLIAPAVLAGAVIACILSVNELVIAIFLSTPRMRTLPAALWPEARDKDTPLLAAASCLSVLATLAGMWLAAKLWRRA